MNNLQRTKVIIINATVTAVEAGLGFLALNNWNLSSQTVLAGLVGAMASAVWNTVLKPLIKEYTNLYN